MIADFAYIYCKQWGFICQYNELQYMPSVICFVVVVVVEIIPAVQTNNTWFASSPSSQTQQLFKSFYLFTLYI